MADVFISYKREELARAAQVARALEDEGYSTFYDVGDGGIHAGETWDKRLERELNSAKCCVVLWSSASTHSDNVRSEARRAKARGVLVPAFIEACEAPIGLDTVQSADLKAWRGSRTDPQWRFLVDRGVAVIVGRAAKGVAPPPPVVKSTTEVPKMSSVTPEVATATEDVSPRLLLVRRLLVAACVALVISVLGAVDYGGPGVAVAVAAACFVVLFGALAGYFLATPTPGKGQLRKGLLALLVAALPAFIASVVGGNFANALQGGAGDYDNNLAFEVFGFLAAPLLVGPFVCWSYGKSQRQNQTPQ
ncbi:MAG: toll/interleukin-1 receptor domain-containing protein [Caulobacterales bacterium]